MTAAQNIAFPLEMRRTARSEITSRVAEALALVKLEGFGHRFPRQLSGGQQQRIAFARAVIFHPRLLLMDEPLGALDKKLREALQLEVMHISRQLGATVIYVTHDQEEALVMSDRIAIFSKGRIEQLGRGDDLYDRPVSLFVADFIGESNILRGRFERDAGGWLVRDDARWRVSTARWSGHARRRLAAALLVRPERRGSSIRMRQRPRPINPSRPPYGTLSVGSTRKYELTLRDGRRRGSAAAWRRTGVAARRRV
jgi:putative spermidine/putrescine transport system ATP-binding protein